MRELIEFKIQMKVGLYSNKPIETVVEEFREAFTSLGQTTEKQGYHSFVFSTQEHRESKSTFMSIIEMFATDFLHIPINSLLIPEHFRTQLALARLSPNSEMFMRNVHAIYLFAMSNLENTPYSVVVDILKLNNMSELLPCDWYYDRSNDKFVTKGYNVLGATMLEIIQIIRMLNLHFGELVYMTDTGTIILPNSINSGNTLIFHSSTGRIEIADKVLYPSDNTSCCLVNSELLNYIVELYTSFVKTEDL